MSERRIPLPQPLTCRLAYGTVGLVTLWLLGVGLWEIAAPFGAGHAAVLPARAIMADNMVRFGILYPVRAYSVGVPAVADAYGHHPWGTYYLFAAARLLLGRHEWAMRLVPVCCSVAMPSLLFYVGRRLWGILPGALVAAGWGVLPIALAFAQFPSFEMFALGACLAVTLAALRYRERPTRGRLWVMLLLAFVAANTDWIASLYVLLAAATATLLVVLGPRSSRASVGRATLLGGIVAVIAVVAVTILFYVVLFQRLGLLAELLNSSSRRAQGNEQPLLSILAHRRYWIEVMFTRLGVGVGVLGAFVMVVRSLRYRRSEELWPLIWLLVSVVHYVYFKNGADVHIYWPLPFAEQFCMSLGVLAAGSDWGIARSRPEVTQRRDYAVFGGLLLVALLVLPDGIRALCYSRDSGNRLNDDGQLNLQDHDKTAALTALGATIPVGTRVFLHGSLVPNWSQDYALERPTASDGIDWHYVLFDLRYAPAGTWGWAGTLAYRRIGPYVMVDLTAKEHGGGQVLGLKAEEPSRLERFFVQGHDPKYRVVTDPYLAWEVREHLGLEDNLPPEGLDRPEHRIVAYNVAVARGNYARAEELLTTLLGEIDRTSERHYLGGTELLGHRLVASRPPRLEIFFRAQGPLSSDSFFEVCSRVIEAPTYSLVVADDTEKKYGTGFLVHPSLWKQRRIYVSSVEVRERPGRERFYGFWRGSERPRTIGGAELVPFFERP